MLDPNPATTPGLLGQMLSHLNGEPLSDAALYRNTVGALYSPPRWIFMDILMSTGHLVQMTKKHWWLWHLPWSEFSVMVFQETKGTLSLSSSPPLLWCDNKSAAHLAANPMFYARTKHIEMDLHFIWDHVLRKQLIIQYLPSSE
ncbi:hypothetical protein CK203_031293 [Vitis vinifera]|uniref:Retrovirus-related Pol polyprotein from transposon RE1 n=1 Tax=Vitis vinifera TaxID=29760 RepID=A0A438IX95_VITVI|nr:hypothetical protein CK203_031293 [Vitis vinifera]